MRYELHKKSLENFSSAEVSLEEAKRKLEEAEKYRAQALTEYERILEQAKKEVTPELVEEAYQEYKEILEGRVLAETREGKYGEARKLLEELEGLSKGYEETPELIEEGETPMRGEIELLLQKHKVGDPKLREHYFNRAGHFQGLNRSKIEILGALETEITTPVKKQKIVSPWTGPTRR